MKPETKKEIKDIISIIALAAACGVVVININSNTAKLFSHSPESPTKQEHVIKDASSDQNMATDSIASNDSVFAANRFKSVHDAFFNELHSNLLSR